MQNKKFVLDSSVFLKIFFVEHDSEKAIKFLNETVTKRLPLLAPQIFIHEVYAACAKNIDIGWTHDLTLATLRKYQPYMEIVDLNENLSALAFQIAQTGHAKSGFPSFYDCLYHALAIQEKCTFVTADEKHFNKTHKKFGHIKLLKNT